MISIPRLSRNYARLSLAGKYMAIGDALSEHGIDIGSISDASAAQAINSFQASSVVQICVLVHVLTQNQPLGVRSAMYRAIGLLWPNNKRPSYRKCSRMILEMRRRGVIPYSWITDGTRHSDKPSSWSGLTDFAETVAHAYRKDLWERQKDYIEVFVEKDAMSGVIRPVTREYDVKLTPIRGFSSETQLWDVAEEWKQIKKPITVYYLGDHDADGLLRIEPDARRRLAEFCGFDVTWKRLAVTSEDFANPNLLGFEVSKKDKPSKWRPYMETYGDRCVEVDAIPAAEIRERVRDAIESHINRAEWEFLKAQEEREREDVFAMARNLQTGGQQ